MRILILSDSHGNKAALQKILMRHCDIKEIFFLGDCVKDIEGLKDSFADRVFHIVSGNCDPFSTALSSDICAIGGIKIFYTHGHRFFVKGGYNSLIEAARLRGCTLAICGHTHIPYTTYDNGVYLVNPGSVSLPRDGKASYAIADIVESGISVSIME